MQGFTFPPSFGKSPRWPTKIATNEHFRSGFRNGNNQNFLLDTFRIPNMYVKKMCSSGVGGVTFLLNYKDNSRYDAAGYIVNGNQVQATQND